MTTRNSQRGNALLYILIIIVVAALVWWWLQGRPMPDLPGGGTDDPVAEDPVDQPVDDPVDEPIDDPVDEPVDDPVDEPGGDAPLTDPDGRIFSFLPVGDLLPNSGPGFVDETVYRPNMLFPTEDPVYLNSQVYRHGGGQGPANGMNGGQCDPSNYDYPWQDTFCEKRDRNQPLCPGGGHEGLDIRPHTCTKNAHWAVAAEDGRVIDIRRHWVTIQTADGTIYNYLHLNMSALAVSEGQTVRKGDRIGKISNDFFKSDGTPTPTTTHLHFEMYENYVAAPGDAPIFTKVNPYMTLVAAYDRKLRGE